MKNQKISNETISEVVEYLSVQLSKSGVKYDYVIGVGRGGLIPATMLAYKLHIPVLCYAISTYDNEEKTNTTIHQEVNFESMCNANILIVDDICDSGYTFEYIKSQIELVSANEVQECTFLSIFAKKSSIDIPDYIGLVTEQNIWLNFPWE
jgi:uncharacterized protein